jgi:Ca-activated chloride channel family protein
MKAHGFAYPGAMYLLTLLPLLGVFSLWAWRQRRRALARLGYAPALRTLLSEQGWLRFFRNFCGSTGLSMLVMGIAGPQWGRDLSQPPAPGRDLVVVLDLSRSMLAEAPSRAERGRAGLIELADAVQQRGGHRFGLVIFAGKTKVLCPLTHDYDHFRDALEQLDLANPPPDLGPGTRIGAALQEAVALHDLRFRGQQDILLISDGDDPAGDGEWHAGAEAARDQQIPVYTVGVGNPAEPSPIPARDGHQRYQDRVVLTRLEEKPLQEIARLTRGSYTAAQTRPLPLVELFHEQIERGPVHEESDDTLPVYQQRFAWFMGPAFALLAGEMLLGWVQRRPRRASP